MHDVYTLSTVHEKSKRDFNERFSLIIEYPSKPSSHCMPSLHASAGIINFNHLIVSFISFTRHNNNTSAVLLILLTAPQESSLVCVIGYCVLCLKENVILGVKRSVQKTFVGLQQCLTVDSWSLVKSG